MVEEVFASSKDKWSRKFIPQKLCTLIHSISFTPKRRRRQSRSITERADSFSIFPLFRIFHFQSRFIINFPLFPNCEERPLSMFNSAQNRPDRPNQPNIAAAPKISEIVPNQQIFPDQQICHGAVRRQRQISISAVTSDSWICHGSTTIF